MAKSAHQKLVLEAMASLQRGRRTAAFETLMLSLVDERDRPIVAEALAQKPAFSATTVKLAHAAKRFLDSRGQFESDDAAIDFVAGVAAIHPEALRRAGKDRSIQAVNQLLKEWKSPSKTK